MPQSAENLADPAKLQDQLSQAKTRLEFYSLPRAVQDRFLASANGRGIPEVILFKPAKRRDGLVGSVLALVGVAALGVLAWVGFGDLSSPSAIQQRWVVGLYCLAAGVAGFGLTLQAVIRSRHERYPYRIGHYLFPVGVIIALNEHLRLAPMTGLSGVATRGKLLRVTIAKQNFDFPLPPGREGAAVKARLEECKVRLGEAMTTHNRKELAAMDPLRDNGFSNPLSSKEPFVRPRDVTLRRLLVGAAAGAVVGGLAFVARDQLAARALYAAARNVDTTAAYRDYIARGGDRAEVRELLLPRAQLKQAQGSLAAVERYAAENPESKIAGEISLALRDELLQALGAVRDTGSLKAIEDFKAAHPRHESVAVELAEARKSVFTRGLNKFNTEASVPAETREFVARLFAFSEKHGPRVLVRFRREVPKSADRADTSIRRSAYFTGTSALPSQYFAAEHAEPREGSAAEALISRLQPFWSPELIRLELGEGLDGGGALPSVKVPTMWISYTTEMSGGYTTQRPRGVYVGLGMMIRADFVIPDGGANLSLKDSSWLPPDVNEIWRENLTPGDVYDRNARLGFERFVDKLLTDQFGLAPVPKPKPPIP